MSEHKARLEYYQAAPELFGVLSKLSMGLHKGVLEPKLVSLVEVRVSQINGCAFCLDMHSKEAKLHGERELRLYTVATWRESPLFDEKEKAALRWAEALTKLNGEGVEDEVFEAVRPHFDDVELTQLSLVIATINAWNRIAVGFRAVPGSLDKAYGLERAGLA